MWLVQRANGFTLNTTVIKTNLLQFFKLNMIRPTVVILRLQIMKADICH